MDNTVLIVHNDNITYPESTTATALHQIADMSRLNTCSNERIYIVMIQFFQLQTQRETHRCIKIHKRSGHHKNRAAQIILLMGKAL